jgi:hypothetical protein
VRTLLAPGYASFFRLLYRPNLRENPLPDVR